MYSKLLIDRSLQAKNPRKLDQIMYILHMCFVHPARGFPFKNEGDAEAPKKHAVRAGGVGQKLLGQQQLQLELYWRKVLVGDALRIAVSCFEAVLTSPCPSCSVRLCFLLLRMKRGWDWPADVAQSVLPREGI